MSEALCVCSKKMLDPELCNLVLRGRPVCNMDCMRKAERREDARLALKIPRREQLARMHNFTHERHS